MPIEFKPFSIPINIEGATTRFQEILQEKTLGICLQGKSIQELEDRIKEFKDVNICWGAMNRFDIYQDYILNKIDKKLEIIMDVGEVKYIRDYETQLRIPRLKKYLMSSSSLLITSEEIIENIKNIGGWDILSEHNAQIIIIEKCRDIQVPNSIMLYLMILAKLKVTKIILFGFDGFGNPKAFKNTPIWDSSEFESEKYCNSTLKAYYRKETVLEQRRIGYRDERASDLHSNCPTFNDQFLKLYMFFCSENNLIPTEIINCSINALYTIFRKISYDQLKGELD